MKNVIAQAKQLKHAKHVVLTAALLKAAQKPNGVSGDVES